MRTQVAAYMAANVYFFFPRMEKYLQYGERPDEKLTYEAYLMGVHSGEIWADIYMLMAISRMWNISISIISPAYKSMWNLFHDSKSPNIVIVSNGKAFGSSRQAWHFSPTEKTLPSAKKLGYDVAVLSVKNVTKRSDGNSEGKRHLPGAGKRNSAKGSL